MFKDKLNVYTNLVNESLSDYLNIEKGYNDSLIKSMKYSLLAGGKRIRPILLLAAYELFSDDISEVIPYACAVEMIHTYSLIHDDLPAMDNDDYRRGRLTNHKVFGEGIAILAGDGLLNHSFEIMLKHSMKQKNLYKNLRAIKEIASSAGINGMIGGQIVDIESENKVIDKDILNYIHLNKTAALITAPLKVGAIIGEADEENIGIMEEIGQSLGLAFQIKDDILDIIGDKNKLGKNIGSDSQNNKSTYPSLMGIEQSIEKVDELTGRVINLLKKYGEKADFLLGLCNYLVDRES